MQYYKKIYHSNAILVLDGQGLGDVNSLEKWIYGKLLLPPYQNNGPYSQNFVSQNDCPIT